jgi:cytochrome b6-f complex iron-sulfur subunit
MKKEVNRRKFVKKTGMATAAILGIGLMPVGCAPYVYGVHYVEADRLRVPKKEFGRSNFLVIQPQGLKAPVLISKIAEDEYAAVLMECTHKQCIITPAGQILTCPCHGSEYDLTGKVIKSPAVENLITFKVDEDETNIYIY